ncbi:MAG: dTDP-4-dehydrorhamnose reductase [Lentisphaerae bacterium]|jgi:dTDP-4-dehydrorhamnose reductase|nr:dTDP-4-dehydrorhamnose reductase [Lentisphaerota bacterium]
MKILITGGNGMLGRTLAKTLGEHQIAIADLPNCDITDQASLDKIMQAKQPDLIIHCAAMTQVDACEEKPEQAFKINETGSENVAKSAAKYNARLIAISTDYVFDGDATAPYQEDHPTNPKTVYGKSKLAGERRIQDFCPNHLILRIAWLYGPGGPSFLHTMLKLADGTRPQLKVVNDQSGNPTSTFAVANHIRLLLDHPGITGIMHLTCEGTATWFEFATEIFRQAKVNQAVIPCTTEEFPRPAPRPHYSSLDNKRLRDCGLPPMPHWKDALAEFIPTLSD